jgi:hypothetical protein
MGIGFQLLALHEGHLLVQHAGVAARFDVMGHGA